MGKISIQQKVIQEIKSHLADPIFVKRTKDIKKRALKEHMDLKGVDDDYWAHQDIDQKFYFEIERLADEYNISQLSRCMLTNYIYLNNFHNGGDLVERFHLSQSIRFSDDNINEFVSIQIHKYTTLDDIRKAWPRIQASFKKKKRIKVRKNLDRDLKIAKLKHKGFSCSKIVKQINSEYTDTILSYDYVSKIIKRISN